MIKRVYIEITNICNLHCAFCKPSMRLKHALDLKEFEHILKEVKPLTSYIYLHVQGEPLIHPQLDEILTLCDTCQMQVQLVTNATFLNQYPNLLSHSSLRKISFSLQSADYQTGIDLKTWMNEMIAVARSVSLMENKYAEFRFWRETDEIKPGYAYCLKRLKEEFDFKQNDRTRNYTLLNHVYVSFADSFEWPDKNHTKKELHGYCHGGIHQLAILSNGTVVPCCLDNEGDIPLGNIFESSLKEILSSPSYKALVQGFKNREITETLCLTCTYRSRFSKDKDAQAVM